MVNEFELISVIKSKFNAPLIGDDAAVIGSLLISKDLLIENIHFKIDNNFFDIGAKSLISNISDIIAMGGKATHFFLGLGIPPKYSFEEIDNLLDGINFISQKYGVTLAGGDTSKSQNLSISITIIGDLMGNQPIYRSNANVDDDIWVTGNLGDSHIGLQIILENIKIPNLTLKEYFIKKHFSKELHPEFIFELNKNKLINSMIDISDGFIQDIGHILSQSSKFSEITIAQIPISENYLQIKSLLNDDFYKIPLYSGEEYELIFTSSYHNRDSILEIGNKHNVKLSNVGKVVNRNSQSRIKFIDSDIFNFTSSDIKNLGYRHF